MDISIAIVTYNNADIIRNNTVSIISAIPDDCNYKLYVIDNNSKDGTLESLNGLTGNIELIQMGNNKGFGHAHNYVIPLLRSSYHFVVNPDIRIEDKEQIKKMIDYLTANEDVGLLSPLIVGTNGEIITYCKRNPTPTYLFAGRMPFKLFMRKQRDKYEMRDCSYKEIMPVEFASGCFMMFRTSVFKKIDGFDDDFFMYLEDADITRRVNQISKAIFYPLARVIHDWKAEGHKSFRLNVIVLQSMMKYIAKWKYKQANINTDRHEGNDSYSNS